MKYMMTFTPAEPGLPSPATGAAIEAYAVEMIRKGVVVLTGGLGPVSHGGEVRQVGGKVIVTDGPFAEAKEVMVGFAIVNAATQEEAIAFGADFMRVAGDGTTEIRPIYEG